MTPPEFDAAAVEHLRSADDTLRRLIDDGGPLDLEARTRGRPDDAYGALLRSIVGQQLSTKAARSIYGRLVELFGGSTPSPQELLDSDPEALRGAGLSGAKVRYVRSLAEHVLSGELELERLPSLGDEEVMREVTAVKGLGEWTAHMFLIFHLGRPDVLPVGDLGVRKGMQTHFGLRKLPEADRMEKLAAPWRPFRSVAAWYMWRVLEDAR